MAPRVRFAPSPTGNVHIGNIRVAIFNWLYARHEDGRFLLRVEDTDRERSTPEAIENLLSAMAWLGLDVDEEPVYQSRNLARHQAVVAEMVAAGHASSGGSGQPTVLHLHQGLFDQRFVTPPKDEVRVPISSGRLLATDRSLLHEVTSSKGKTFITPYNWDAMSDLSVELADGTMLNGDEVRGDATAEGQDVTERNGQTIAALLFKRRYVVFEDMVLGHMEKPLDSLRDLVIVRSDGSPVFHLANVVDDVDMGITHVLRGNDHVENVFRHLFIYQAMGESPPAFGHFPMIVNAKGKPYSKRDGDAFVGDFRAKGYLAETLFNFLALCGWSPGDDRELMDRSEMVEAFDLSRVNASAAQFNQEKLEWMNGMYLTSLPAEQLLPLIREELAKEEIDVGEVDPAWLAQLVDLEKERMKSVSEFVHNTHFFWVDEVAFAPKAVKKHLLKKDGAGLLTLKAALAVLEGVDPWTVDNLGQFMEGFAAERSLGMGQVAQPIRVAITGTGVSRGIWETLALLGKERSLQRITRALTEISPA